MKRILDQGCKPLRRTWKGRRSLWSDERGATIIEFAFVATPLAAIMVAILQTSLVFFAQQNLETVVQQSARLLLTGQAQKAGMTATQYQTAVCAKLPAFLKCANVIVDVQTVSDFSSANTSPLTPTYDANGKATNNKYLPGGPGSINVVRIMYVWNVGKGPLGFDLSTMSNQQRLLVATSVFKTEPYS